MSHTLSFMLTSIVVAAMLTPSVCSAEAPTQAPVKRAVRYGSVIGLRAEKIEEYKKLHAAIWPEVAKAVAQANIRNYSIYMRKLPDGKNYLFGYFEYVGDDFKADMAKMAENADVKRWWKATDACQEPLPDRKPGENWTAMEEVFHQD